MMVFLLLYGAYLKAQRCHSWSLPGFLLELAPGCFTPPGGTIILSRGYFSQQCDASPRENHTLLLFLFFGGFFFGLYHMEFTHGSDLNLLSRHEKALQK